MNIHRIYYPVLTLGPGSRIGIWTRGCRKKCPGCMSPELRSADPGREIPLATLKKALADVFCARQVDGVTISGGEPVVQYAQLLELLFFLARYTEDILLYTGYTREELGTEKFGALSRLANLVLGPYMETLNDGGALRGSANQEILLRSDAQKKRYEKLLAGPRTVQAAEGPHALFLIGILG